MLEKLKGWRTIIVSALFALMGAVSAIPDVLNVAGINWQSVVSQEVHSHAGVIIAGMSLVFALLRWITTTPVGVAPPT